jgi:hypothetical protein
MIENIQNYIDTMQKKTKEGITAKELQEYYSFLRDNTESVKTFILEKINNSEKYKRKRKATKENIMNEIYETMQSDLIYCVQETFTFRIDFSGNHKETQRKALENIIFNATDEQIKMILEGKQKFEIDKKEYIDKTIEGMKNPKTLEDFQNIKSYRKTPLTDKEQELYDYLYTVEQKEKREKEQQERKEKFKSDITASTDIYTIAAELDTRDNSELWVVRLKNRVDKNEFNNIRNGIMKPIDGYYSRFKNGFIFKYDPTSKLLGEQAEQAQVEQQEEQPKTSADKLRKVADNMQNTIDDLRRERLSNTAKRARQAASAENSADNLERTQQVLKSIAQAMDNNELKFINTIDSKVQIETLNNILNRANWKKKEIEKIDYNTWKETPVTIDIIKYAEIPSNTIYKDQLQRIVFDIRNTDGFKLISNRLQKHIDNAKNDRIDITELEDEFDKIYKNTDILKGQYFETAVEERRRLERMGINLVEELRAYLREFWAYKNSVKTTVDPVQKKIKELERQYKLEQKGDINFTPPEVALFMIELADIEEDSKILEPEAGIGNIADQIRKFTDNIDVCEKMFSYVELLKLKGYNVVGNDFMQLDKYNEYSYIIMNPPFSCELEHIKHAYDLLKTDGKIISITSPHWTFASDRKSQEFKNWFDQIGGEIVDDLESGTFEMTGVKSQIIVINKDVNAMQEAV